MEKKESFQKIFKIIKSIVEQIDCISKYPETIPQIEIDIAKNNLQYVYELILKIELENNNSDVNKKNNSELTSDIEAKLSTLLLKTEQLNKENKITVNNPAIKETEKDITTELPKIKANLVSSNFSSLNQIKEPEVVIIKPTINIDNKEIEEIKIAEKSIEQKKIKTPTIEKSDVQKNTLGENIKEDKVLVNDKMIESSNNNTLAGKLQKKSIKDIKSAIGINDKISIIKEIFAGNAEKYTEFINLLNSSNSKEEVSNLLEKLKLENHIDEDSSAFQVLINIINRKF